MKPGKRIVAQAPCRVDLAGGTLDLWPLYLFHPGSVTVNFAVRIMTRCEIRPQKTAGVSLKSLDTGREDRFASVEHLATAASFRHPLAGHLCQFFVRSGKFPRSGFRLVTHSESPAGAGISGSSALMVATTAALARYCNRKLDREEIRVIAQNVEAQLIKVPTGCQDYYPALYGGMSAIALDEDGVHRKELSVSAEEINSRFMLVYTGAPRQSGINNWEVFRAHIEGNRRVFRNFESISGIARGMRDAVAAGNWNQVRRLLRREWNVRKTNAPGITTPLIERLVAVAESHGAGAAKVCGAGGGGCFILLVDPAKRHQVAAAVTRARGVILPLEMQTEGLQVKVG
jgi:D-glycero-alpha-D-manno-heptose-7-phosphate kinase